MRKKPQKQARTVDRLSPLSRTRTRKARSAPAQAAVDRAVRAAIKRERQLRDARDRYRRRHKAKLRAKDRDRRRLGRREWTLPPIAYEGHDPVKCAKGHAEDCPYFSGTPTGGVYEMAAEPDPEVAPMPRRRHPATKRARPAPRPRDDRLDGLTPLQRARVRLELDHLEEVVGCQCFRCFDRLAVVKSDRPRPAGPNRGGESSRSWNEAPRGTDLLTYGDIDED